MAETRSEDGDRRGKNVVICCDGTGNQVSGDLSNVLKLFRIASKDDRQRVYYHPGVGTIGEDSDWARRVQDAKAVLGLVTGWGLDDNILGAYRFLCRTWEEGDRIFLFGFSRGAYTVRALAGFIHMIGLLRPDQLDIAGYALTAYKKCGGAHEERQAVALKARGAVDEPDEAGHEAISETRKADENDPFEAAWDFSRTVAARRATIHFMGVWDTVASMIVPRRDRLGFQLRTLPYTRRNPSVRAFRHAMAVDERRRMFRLNRWDEGQMFVERPFHPKRIIPQDCAQRWFAGVHSDIGGGYPEPESSLSKLPLIWMIEEAVNVEDGLRINTQMFNHLARGIPRKGWTHAYVAADPCGPEHNSLTKYWQPLEYVPKSTRWREWRKGTLGFYFPRGEPRVVEPGATLDPGVEQRLAGCPNLNPRYAPINLVEPRQSLPPEPASAKLWRAAIGITLMALAGAGLAWCIWRVWGKVGPFLLGLGLTTATVGAALFITLFVGTAWGLLRDLRERRSGK
jgi:uncharacterized protein (DUF2235 family)